MKIKIILFIMLLGIIPTLCLAGDVVVIINPSVSESALTMQDVGNIYLGKKTSWSDGNSIKFVVLKGATHTAFLENCVGKTESQFETFWKKQVFTGKGTPPKELDSDQAMVEYVAQNPGTIGYVSAGTDVSKVKTVTIK